MFPAAPAGALPAQVGAPRVAAGSISQPDDFRNAEREFAAALKQQPRFIPRETAMAYIELARGNEKDAAERFDRALEADAGVCARAGRPRPGAARARSRRARRWPASKPRWPKDPSLTELRGRVEVLRFRATQDMLARAKAAAEARRWDEAQGGLSAGDRRLARFAFLYRELAAGRAAARARPPRRSSTFARPSQLDPTDARSLAAIGAILEARAT